VKFLSIRMLIYSVLYFIDRAVTATRPVAREENPSLENFSPPGKMPWTKF